VLCVLVVGGRVVARLPVGRRNRGVGLLHEVLKNYVFGDEPLPADRGDGEILKTWLRQARDRVSWLDLGPVTSLTEAKRLLRAYLADGELLGGRVLHR
jgi:hypothetical protein